MTPEEFKALEAQAQTGDPQAMFNLAYAYRIGDGVEANPEQFFLWTKQAAEADFPAAIYNLALAYHDGTGTEADLTQFFNWTKQAAEARHPKAMFNLALAYKDGTGTEADLTQFFNWTKQAAEADFPAAIYNLALAYKDGIGTEADLTQFFNWTKQAAEARHPKAMFNLALAYKDGIDTDINLKQYFSWTKKAAEAGNRDAMLNLARAYRDGIGTRKNKKKYIEAFQDPLLIDHPQALCLQVMKMNIADPAEQVRARALIKQAIDLDFPFAVILKRLLELHDGELFRLIADPLLSLFDVIDSIKERHLVQLNGKDNEKGDSKQKNMVAHYTDRNTLKKMLPLEQNQAAQQKHNHFRLYNIEYLNDPDEGRKIDHVIEKSHSALFHHFFKERNNHFQFFNNQISIYTCSFSFAEDSLDLWRAYGRDGLGISIVTPLSAFEQDGIGNAFNCKLAYSEEISGASPAGRNALAQTKSSAESTPKQEHYAPLKLYAVKYGDDQVKNTIDELAPALRKIQKIKLNDKHSALIKECVLILLSDIMFLYKSKDYENEQEARLIHAAPIDSLSLHIDESEVGRIFARTKEIAFEHSGSKVIIGPKVPKQLGLDLTCRYILARHDKLKNTEVVQSTIHYR